MVSVEPEEEVRAAQLKLTLIRGVCLSLLGFSVNIMWVYVQTAAQDVANYFQAPEYMPILFTGCQFLCGCGAFSNALWFAKWRLWSRSILNTCVLAGGIVMALKKKILKKKS